MRRLVLLKAVNSAATALFDLLVTFVFVRALGVEGFAQYALLAAIANYPGIHRMTGSWGQD
ncbi:MAG: hypothetical protein FJX68_02470 [Alphaproteobacteria bacterium]|nr:hypothetical protein [Alphaproteobacteria bacterium]